MYAHSNEVEELGVISLFGVNVESDPLKESLLGVSVFLFFFFCQVIHLLRFPFFWVAVIFDYTHTHTHTH